jgi:two-component system LytT family response regulator
MNCIVVDDSKMARNAITLLIAGIELLDLKKECESSLEAFNYLKTENIDLIFLDVEMPGMTGIELVKNLKNPPIIILVTSKKEYAVEAFELNIADYIIKPVTMARLMVAVDRAKEIYDSKGQEIEIDVKEKDYVFVRSKSTLIKIKLSDILYIQALGDYVNIFASDKRHTLHCTLKSIEEKLPSAKFFRLHRSYLVAIDHIDKVAENDAHISKHVIPIGEQYRKELIKKFNLL